MTSTADPSQPRRRRKPNPPYKNRSVRIREHLESEAGALIEELLAAGITLGTTVLGTVGLHDAATGISSTDIQITLKQATRLASLRHEISRLCQVHAETGIWAHRRVRSFKARQSLRLTWRALQAVLLISKAAPNSISSAQLATACDAPPRSIRNAIHALVEAKIVKSLVGGGGKDGPRGGYMLIREPHAITLVEIVELFNPVVRAIVEGLSDVDRDLFRWPLSMVSPDELARLEQFFINPYHAIKPSAI